MPFPATPLEQLDPTISPVDAAMLRLKAMAIVEQTTCGGLASADKAALAEVYAHWAFRPVDGLPQLWVDAKGQLTSVPPLIFPPDIGGAGYLGRAL